MGESQPAPGDTVDAYTVNPVFRWMAGPSAILTDLSAGFPDRRISDRETLHYTSEPLTSKLEIGGAPETHLWVSSTAGDGEFFACLEDVGGMAQSSTSHRAVFGRLIAASRRAAVIVTAEPTRRLLYPANLPNSSSS